MKKKLTMLVVESAGTDRILLNEMFQSEYHVIETEDFISGMQMLYENEIDVMIFDARVFDTNGGSVLQQIKADDVLKNIPVIVRTTKEEKLGALIQTLEVEDVILSACDPVIVKKRVHNIVQRYKLEQEITLNKIEEEKHLNQMREAFVVRMSQELRNPVEEIMEIVNQSDRFKDDPDQVRKAFQKIKDQTEYLQSLTNNIQDIPTVKQAKNEPGAAAFELNTVVADLSREYDTKCRQKGIEFAFEVANVHYETLIGDSDKVRRIWGNLLSNAFQCTGPGGWIRTFFTENIMDEKHIELEITVEYSEKPGCSEGKKQVFIVKLPFELGNESMVCPKKFNSMKAMVIDDDEIASNYHAVILARLGIHCTVADDPKQAIMLLEDAAYKGNGYDICFINWYMHQAKGPEAIREIRNKFNRDSIILVSSSKDLGSCESQMKEMGVDYILERPVLQSSIYHLMTDICKENTKRKVNCHK